MHQLVKKFMEKVVSDDTNLCSIAEITGIAHPSLYRWRKGQHCPTLTKFDHLLSAFGWRLTIESLWRPKDHCVVG